MPAGLPGSTVTQNNANPNAGRSVLMDALSGPKGSPLDNSANTIHNSTGGLSTGIGFTGQSGGPFINTNGPNGSSNPATPPQAIRAAGFTDDTGTGLGLDSTIVYIGGGNMVADSTYVGVPFTPLPYTAGFVPTNAGNGGSRDGGAGPAFTGFMGKWVTAVAQVINGGVVEAGWVNRSGVTIEATDSVFGSDAAAQVAPTTA